MLQVPSIAKVQDFVLGYPEISYFISDCLLPSIADNETLTNRFKEVSFSDSSSH